MENSQQPIRPQPIVDDHAGMSPVKKKRFPVWLIAVIAAIGAMFVLALITVALYFFALRPVNTGDTTKRSIEIVSGTTPDAIGKQLKENHFIRNQWAFAIYTRLGGVQNKLQAGTYELSSSQSTQEVVSSLVKGPSVEEFEVTFLPGATLAQNKKALMNIGYKESEVDEALTDSYNSHPVFEGRPEGADLEGYLFGETHRFLHSTPVKEVVKRFLDDFYAVVKENDLIAAYKKQGLSLYEGIILASIIQRESGGDDEAQIAQVFLLRRDKGMQLGSDVTYQYIADKLGVARDVNLDNKYNTRRYAGLPPGPISTPGKAALLAVAHPAKGDYLYFLSGDDGVTYFGHTEEEHNANIKKHCEKKCQII